ncbi:MAG: alpha/beta fold hydrolase [Bacteroidota bacterium]|nr:alpha/beta fold hydrolase [Bacteroidota bacterium]
MSESKKKSPPEIYFDDIGEGNVIVLLHGFLESTEIWKDFSKKLSKNFRVISIDLPGHGKSGVINEIHSMDLMAIEVRNILEISGINKCVMVGHSMGGYTAIAFAKKFRRFLKGLILFHSHVEADNEEAKINRDRTVEIVENNHFDFINSFTPSLFAPQNVEKFSSEIKHLIALSKKTPKEGVISAIKGMKERKDNLDTLKRLNIPVLFISGEQDSRIAVEKVKKQAEVNEKVSLEILKNVGHMGFIEAKEESFKLIRNFAQTSFSWNKNN